MPWLPVVASSMDTMGNGIATLAAQVRNDNNPHFPLIPCSVIITHMDNISVWAAFGAGMVSFFTPCVLPMVPVYLASLAGPEILESSTLRRRPLFLHSLSFVAGFALMFTLMGALAGMAGFLITPNSVAVKWISGIVLILFGAYMLASLKVPWLNFEKRLSPKMSNTTGYLRSAIIGGIFTVAWTPCLSPLLGGVLDLAFISETAGRGAGLLAVYSLGLGVPFLLMGAFFGFLSPLLRKIARYSRWIYAVSGVLLVLFGLLIITGKLSWFSGLGIAAGSG